MPPFSPALSSAQRTDLLRILKTRFEAHMPRHPILEWTPIQSRLEGNADALWSLHEMERTGGEPDVIGQDTTTGAFFFVDCSPESPIERRNVCYDKAGWTARKSHRPTTNAVDLAATMGITLLSETQYRVLQAVGSFDLKTSSWLNTPSEIRQRSGALFGECRYGQVFVYHNGASAYFGVRGFRGILPI